MSDDLRDHDTTSSGVVQWHMAAVADTAVLHADLVERLRAASRFGGRVVFVSGDEQNAVSWEQLHAEAASVALELASSGVQPGSHVAVLAPTSRSLVTVIQAVWLAGATLVVLPLPMRLASVEELVRQVRARVRAADTALLVVDPDLAPYVAPEPGDPPLVRLDELVEASRRRDPSNYVAPPPDPERLAILQFTSGSTADPKGVMLPERVLLANLDAVCAAGQMRDHEVFVSWLPLYHDMGLVGMLSVPMTTGRDLVLGAPQDFLGSPGRWMRWVSEHRGTVTAGPNFSWVLTTRALRRESGLDLSSLRIALNGAEPVDPRAVRAFVEAAEPHGLDPHAVFPAFGMAEVGIGCTFPAPMEGLRVDVVDRDELEAAGRARQVGADHPSARELVCLGRPVPGLELRVVATDGDPLPERHVGEVEVMGTSVTPGYYRNPSATSQTFRGSWLRTGDLGYLTDTGELVLCGRIKDLIIVGGRNVYPQDIEQAVGEVDGIRAGNVVAFGVDGGRGKEQVVVVAELRSEDYDLELVRKHARERALEATGLPPRDVVLVPKGTLPKTSSGKLQRSLSRTRYLQGELPVLG